MGLFVVQLLLVVYQFSFTVEAGRPESNARATRLGPGVLMGHLMLSVLAALLWIGWKAYGNHSYAWAAFVAVLLAGGLQAVIAQRSVLADSQVDGPSADPADHVAAETRTPTLAEVVLGAMTAALVVLTFFVAIGVFG